MIDVVWINGPFGVGKTTVARALATSLPRSRIVDPERIGWILQRLTRGRDFQDLESWRRWTVRAIRVASRATRGPVIVPMTVDDDARRAELLGALREAKLDVLHVTLLASRETIRARLAARGGETAWAERRLEACLASLSSPERGGVETDARSVAEITADIAARVRRGEGQDR